MISFEPVQTRIPQFVITPDEKVAGDANTHTRSTSRILIYGLP